MTSSKALYDYFEQTGDLYPSIISDLFGYANWSTFMKENQSATLTMFLGLFKGLYLMNVSCREIHRCFLRNELDDFIHMKYFIHKSGYYREFCEKQIKIGNTCLMLELRSLKEEEEEEQEEEEEEEEKEAEEELRSLEKKEAKEEK